MIAFASCAAWALTRIRETCQCGREIEDSPKSRLAAVLSAARPVILALLASLAAAAPQPPYFQPFDVETALQPNGDFVVIESQTAVFGLQSARHGFRVIPMDRAEQGDYFKKRGWIRAFATTLSTSATSSHAEGTSTLGTAEGPGSEPTLDPPSP
ncbi:MAG TPA: hypothetical protein VHS06_12425 [Chloroflexota bacterium]|nr:hypothetical protein [Chloroflexota bacterium]